jgi:hypothetical protein
MKPQLNFRFFGGPNQLHSENYDNASLGSLWHEYHKSALMRFLVGGQRVEPEYVIAAGRNDADLKKKFDRFEATRKLDGFGKKSCSAYVIVISPSR